ncbi:alkaline phosphatase family protein [Salinirubrum litoreum]|uniref:Alkaline phosphatase family protein n=1 Tax=Salinirubrum litoreum TaxID=1126234 RepID=A0ABD5RG11_9EURY|nr:alkaline phosphatase family protein [Salinirubrum litoreum]
MSGPAVVIGLDGVPWDFIERWTDDGHLPNFARLREEGAAGPCQSTVPALTALAWPSITTGVRPDKHGLYAFSGLQPNYSHSLNTSRQSRHPAMWDALRSVVVNVPMTYPASDIDGIMITGMMTPDGSPQFTHPPEFRDRLESDYPDYRIGLDWKAYYGRPTELAADLGEVLSTRRRLMNDLLDEDFELFFFVYTEPDRLQHLVWDEDLLRSHYERLDDVIGDALAHVEANDGTLYVVSDHGFGPVKRQVNLNTILRDAGFLTPASDDGVRGLLSRAGLTKSRVLDGLEKVGVSENHLVRYLPRQLVDSAAATVPGDHGMYDVNHGETDVFAHGMGNIYINTTDRFDAGTVAPSERDRVKTEIVELFRSVQDPETGERPLRVADGDDLFPTDPDSPDLVVEAGENYTVSTGKLTTAAFSSPTNLAADHKPEGIFLAWGPDIAAGVTPEDATVYDFAPTVLHGMGEPVPDDADGRVLSEIFTPGSSPAETPVASANYGDRVSDGDDEEDDFSGVEDRLKGLGYME